MGKNKSYIFVVSAIAAFISACSPKVQPENNLKLIQDSQNIVSTRGTPSSQIFTLIKLKSPALLETAKRSEGLTQIDQKLKLKIESEQAEAIQALLQLSSDVQVVYRYKLVLNALAIVAPQSIEDKLGQIGVVASIEAVSNFQRAVVESTEVSGTAVKGLQARNSVKFIGAEDLHQSGITGRGVKVGILDTGIDYTHAMFGGVGTEDAYKAIDPAQSNAGFPSAKVVGGVDLVGTQYNAAAEAFAQRIPKPDLNPLDEAGHGTHVAGTIAGKGDGISSYDGVAPDADLYGIKVFGANGSTSDMVVIAGLEYAVDPNGDGVLDDQLDVVNLSLGSSYGSPKLLYAEAIKNLVKGGTSAVISAGNSGRENYIVGAPGTTTEALSVAASIDDTEHNWIFNSSLIKIGSESMYVEAIEAVTTRPTQQGPVSGELHYIGLADKDLTPQEAALLSGKVALIDRGGVSFNDKIKRAAQAGALGVVVVNNAPGAAIVMSTVDKFNIPAIMVSLDVGQKIKAALSATPAVVSTIEFLGDQKIQKPELIDTITSFSSKGPRSVDGYLKPEIAAPGYQIISAARGTGAGVVQMSGTSMAAPHMTGVMALLAQSLKSQGKYVSALEMKNIAMGHAKTISESGTVIPVTLQGAGRVQAIPEMMNSLIVADVPSLSFGEVSVEAQKTFTRVINFKNLSGADHDLSFAFEGHPGVKLILSKSLKLPANKTQIAIVRFQIDARTARNQIEEFGGVLKVLENGLEIYRIPLLAVVHQQSEVSAQARKDSSSNQVTVSLENNSIVAGEVYLFNLLSLDDRKVAPIANKNIFNTECDVQSAGYRILNKTAADGTTRSVLQFAVKTFKPMTHWNYCDISVLFDADKDGVFDQELVATNLRTIPGQAVAQFSSILLDATIARKIRGDYEAALKLPVNSQTVAPVEDYSGAIQDVGSLQIYNGSTLAILEVDLAKVNKDAGNNLNFKILSTYYVGSPVEFDDYLKKGSDKEGVFTISATEQNQAFYGFSPVVTVAANVAQELILNKGATSGQLIGYYPQNDLSDLGLLNSKQFQVIRLK